MNILTISVIGLLLAASVGAQDTCAEQNYIIPYETLDTVFDGGINAVRSQEGLATLIQQPSIDNVRAYIITIMPFSAPLFAMAGLTFIIFVATIIQVICFNTCGKE